MPLKARRRPPVLSERVTWPTRAERLNPEPGVIYSNDVYEGVPEQLQGRAKFLRVLSIDAKTYTYWHKRPYLSTGPVVSGVQSEGVKRILGTVPVEKDGSVSFRAPSGIPLHFQLLDERYPKFHTCLYKTPCFLEWAVKFFHYIRGSTFSCRGRRRPRRSSRMAW